MVKEFVGYQHSEHFTVESASGKDPYVVRIDVRVEATYCNCLGFAYNQKCRHLAAAMEQFDHKVQG